MTIWTIIPVKHLADSKRRLEHVLSPGERADLIATFLGNLLDVLNQVRAIDQVVVVTADRRVADLALRHGAAVLTETQPYDLNGAVGQGRDYALSEGASAVLVLPADLPFARTADIEAMLRPLGENTEPLVALCSDETGDGTNALVLAPAGGFTFHYGSGSAVGHAAEAVRRNRDVVLVRAPGLRFDLDTESDWLAYSGYTVQVADE